MAILVNLSAILTVYSLRRYFAGKEKMTDFAIESLGLCDGVDTE